MVLQFLINGLVTGAVYAIVSLGFAIVYNTTKILHIVYAALFVTAPYLVFYFYKEAGLAFGISIVLAILFTTILSVIIDLIIYKPLKRKNSSLYIYIISSLGAFIILTNVIALFFGNELKTLQSELSNSIQVSNIILTLNQIIQFLISTILILFFLLFLKFTKFGIITRAIRDNPTLSNIFGVNTDKFRIYLFLLSGFFVAIGGILASYDIGMDPYVGMPMFVNALVALIIGGIGKFHGPIIGAFILALLQSLVIWQFSASWENAVTFSLLIVFLILRPQGIVGEKSRAV